MKTLDQKQPLNADNKRPEKVGNTPSGMKTLVIEHMPELKRKIRWQKTEVPASKPPPAALSH